MPWRAILSMLVVIALGGATLTHFIDRGLLKIAAVEIVADPDSQDPEMFLRVKAALNQKLDPLKGQWVWQLRLEKILQEVESDRRVKSARVARVFPNLVRIVVEPQKPVLALLSPEGWIYPVAADGSLLNPLAQKEIPDVPVLRGRGFMADAQLRSKVVALILEMPEHGLFSREQISEITYQAREGFNFVLNRDGVEVEVGEGPLGPRSSRVEKVLNYLYNQQLKARVIDARFEKKIVVRMRNGS